jgi:hypothetical protein
VVPAKGVRAGSSCDSSIRTVFAGAVPTGSFEVDVSAWSPSRPLPAPSIIEADVSARSPSRPLAAPSVFGSALQVNLVRACQHEGNGR